MGSRTRIFCRTLVVLATLGLAAGGARSAAAATCTLVGTGTGSWTNEAIWSCGGVSRDVASGDDVVISGTRDLIINTNVSVVSITVQSSFSGTITASAGPRTITTSGDFTLEGGSWPATNVSTTTIGGTMYLNGGTYNKSTTVNFGSGGLSLGGGTLAGFTSVSVSSFSYSSGTLSGVTSLTVTDASTINGTFTPPATFSTSDLSVTAGTFTCPSTSFTIGDDLSVSGGTFDCDALTRVTIPGDVATSGASTFLAPTLLVVAGAVDLDNTSGAFTGGSGTVLLTSSGTQSHDFDGTSVSINNLVFNNGLVGYWRLDESSNGTASDYSGWGNHLSHVNTPTFNSSPASLKFKNPYAITMAEGSAQHATMALTSATYDSTLKPSTWTISAWVSMSSATDGSGSEILSINNDYLMRVNNTGTLRASHYNGTTSEPCDATTVNLLSAGWKHVAATFDGSNIYIYVSGSLVKTCGMLTAQGWSTADEIRLGGHPSNTAYYMNGSIDDVRFYGRVLGADEIALLAAGTNVGYGTPVHTVVGDMTVGGALSLVGGTLAGSGAITVSGGFRNMGGLFTGTGTVTLSGSTGGELFNGPFSALTINSSGQTWTLQERLWVSGNLTITAGTLATSNYTVHAGSLKKADGAGAVFTAGTGTLVIDSSSNTIITSDGTLNNLRFEDPTETNLVGYYKFDEPNGTTAKDSSGNGNHGTLAGATKRINSGLPNTSGTPAIAFDNAGAVSFGGTGTDQRITFPISAQWNPISISAFIYVPASPEGESYPMIVELPHFRFYISSTNQLGAYSERSGSDGDWRTKSTDVFTRGQWNHVAVTYDGTSTTTDPKFYLNGAQLTGTPLSADTAPSNTSYNNTSTTAAIGNRTGLGNDFSGYIDDVRIYNDELTLSEIQALAAGGYAGMGGVAIYTRQSNTTVSGTTTVDSGTTQTVYRAHEINSGSIEGFPSVAFDWADYDYWATYVCYNNASGGNTGVVYKRTTTGAASASYTLPSGVNCVGSPRWTHDGVQNSSNYYVWVLGSNGAVYRITDSSFTVGLSYGGASSGTSPLALDGTNVYWTGNSGSTPSLFRLAQDFSSNAVVAAGAPTGATASLVNGSLYYANATALYKAVMSPLGTPSGSSWSPSAAVYGRVSVQNSVVYFIDNAGKLWAADPSTLANTWSYQDTATHGGSCSSGASACAAKNLFVNRIQNRIYYGDYDGHLYAVDTATRTKLANYPYSTPGGEIIEAAPLYRSGIIVVGTTSGKVFLVDQTNTSSAPALRTSYDLCLSSPCTGSAVSTISMDFDGGQYVVGTKDGKLFYLDSITDNTSPE